MVAASADKAAPDLPQAALASAAAAGALSERDGAPFDVVELYAQRHRPAEFLVTALNAAFGAPYARSVK